MTLLSLPVAVTVSYPAPLTSLPALPEHPDLISPADIPEAIHTVLTALLDAGRPVDAGGFYAAVQAGPFGRHLPPLPDLCAALPANLSALFADFAALPPPYVFLSFSCCADAHGASYVKLASNTFIACTPAGMRLHAWTASDNQQSWQTTPLTSTPVCLLAQTSSKETGHAADCTYILSISDRLHTLRASLLFAQNGNNLFALLAACGVKFSWQHRALLLSYFSAAKPQLHAIETSSVGWHSDPAAFICGKDVLAPVQAVTADVSATPLLLSAAKPFPQGTCTDATQSFAILSALPSPMHRIACYAALAAPLLRILDLPGFTLHFHGRTSTGKTSALELAALCYASTALPATGEASFLSSWDTTEKALEALCLQHNDLPLPLDELRKASPTLLSSAIYTIADGLGRSRLSSASALQETASWRTLALSSGEIALWDILPAAYGGQRLRFLELPADKLAANFPEMEKLKASLAALAFPQRPGAVFLQYLLSVDKNYLKSAFASLLSAQSGVAIRLEKHMCLLLLAAREAIACGALPDTWTQHYESDLAAFAACTAPAALQSDFSLACAALQDYILRNIGVRILPLASAAHASASRERAGWYTLATMQDDTNESNASAACFDQIYLLPSALAEALTSHNQQSFLAECKSNSLLPAASASRYTSKAPSAIPGRPWTYKFDYQQLAACCAAQ